MKIIHSPDRPIHYDILDSLYRINESHFLKLWKNYFDVTLDSARYIKADVSEEIYVGKQMIDEVSIQYLANSKDGVYTALKHDQLILCSIRPNQKFVVFFKGDLKAIKKMKRELDTFKSFYISVFIYYFNRLRASKELHKEVETERQEFEQLVSLLKKENPDVNDFLAKLVELADVEHATISVYSGLSRNLVTVNTSPGLDLKEFDSIKLNEEVEKKLIKNHSFIQDIDENTECGKCQFLTAKGTKHAHYFPIYSITPNGISIRAMVTLYSAKEVDENNMRMLNLDLSVRQVARWIHDFDSKIAKNAASKVLSFAHQACSKLNTIGARYEIMPNTLSTVETVIAKSALKILTNENLAITVDCAMIAGSEVIDPKNLIPDGYSNLDEHSANCPSIIKTKAEGVCLVIKSISSENCHLFVSSDSRVISSLEESLFIHLSDLVGLIHHFAVNERKRISWVGKTMHEVRQPLQGLVVVAEEIQRMAEHTNVSRKKLANYAEDMGYSTLRLKAVMHLLSSSVGHTTQIKKRSFFIEDHVIRPIRRVLEAPAREKELTINTTSNYLEMPELYSDPDLLSLVIYNIFDNALKYSNEGSLIRVMCVHENSKLRVDFLSDGKKIMSNERTSIFNEGYRGEAVKYNEVGLGVGLSTCKKICELLGLTIKLISPEDIGGSNGFRVSGFEKIIS